MGVAGEAFPIGPLGGFGDLLRGADGFPLGGGDDSDEIAFHDTCALGYLVLSMAPAEMSVEPTSFRMDHTGVEHVRAGGRRLTHFSLAATLEAVTEFLKDLPMTL